MATYKKITVNSSGVVLRFALKKPDKTAWNLTDATVQVILLGGNVLTEITGACTIDSAALGTCHYDMAAADTAMPGKYSVNCQITKGDVITGSITEGELEII